MRCKLRKTIEIYLDRYPSVLVVGPLSDPLKWDDKISITSVSITSVSWVRFESGNYLLQENVVITFRSYVRIMSESYVWLTSGNYVIKSCKWDQKITYWLRLELGQDYVPKITLELRHEVMLDLR